MKRYAVCGVSNRAMGMFLKPMLQQFRDGHQAVALLDSDPLRHQICKSLYPELAGLPEYGPDDFDRMAAETKPDIIIVAGRDDTHAGYIVRALEHDLDVFTEKPMATTAADCARILVAEAKSRGKVTVTFNYRYNPIHTRIKEMILDGAIGRVVSVDLNWYIDTYHGASYFKRWNRNRGFSGGLSIHKSSHHFDLVNWWTGQKPVEAFAYGALNFFGADGELNPSRKDGRHCMTCDERASCAYYRRWASRTDDVRARDDHIGALPLAGKYSGYSPDMCIFDSEIAIEDTYSAVVRYDGGAMLSYSVLFSAPYEGYRLAINGTKGRIETKEYHELSRIPFPVPEQTIDYFPMFGSKETIHVVRREGGHGGGDPVLIEDLFLGPDPARGYPILSGSTDGAYAVATGEAVWRAVKSAQPVRIADILA